MYFKPTQLAVDFETAQHMVTAEKNPVFSWAAEHTEKNQYQTQYRIVVKTEKKQLWDSGWQQERRQQARYEGLPLPEGSDISWSVQLQDRQGRQSEIAHHSFFTPLFEEWSAPWICATEDREKVPVYFHRQFLVKSGLRSAVLYVCGVGYQAVYVNGKKADTALLQPAVSNYKKQCYYVTLPVKELLLEGENALGIIVADGWRRNKGKYLKGMKRQIEFFGPPQLTAQLVLEYEEGREVLQTDEHWLWGRGGVVEAHLFDGETYDARRQVAGWGQPGFCGDGFQRAALSQEKLGTLRPQSLPPIREKARITPIAKTLLQNGAVVFDFGENLAGYVEIKLPSGMSAGETITIRHAENLRPDGSLDTETIRGALAKDTYIASGKEEQTIWHPLFTYHGFRYVQVEGYPGIMDIEDIRAVRFYTDIDARSHFRCGSALANQIYENALRTERSNIHGIATDCPQRDERMAWMNDATVRFEQMPYHFHIGRLFPKILDDIIAEQSDDGAITCTAPFVYGQRPADPACSSFLICGVQQLLHCGDEAVVRRCYPAWKAWNDCLKAHSDGGIVNYSYYGDWAPPADCCDKTVNGARSVQTPGRLMSTGYHYLNYKLLAHFADVLGDEQEKKKNLDEAARVLNCPNLCEQHKKALMVVKY